MQRYVPARTAQNMEGKTWPFAVRTRCQAPPVRLDRIQHADPGGWIVANDLLDGQLCSRSLAAAGFPEKGGVLLKHGLGKMCHLVLLHAGRRARCAQTIEH